MAIRVFLVDDEVAIREGIRKGLRGRSLLLVSRGGDIRQVIRKGIHPVLLIDHPCVSSVKTLYHTKYLMPSWPLLPLNP